jgi:hypothetical protein
MEVEIENITFSRNFTQRTNNDLKKSDALVGRVNTFIILHTKEFKKAFKNRNL